MTKAGGSIAQPFQPVSVSLEWNFPDPSAFTGTDEEKLAQTREIRDAIKSRIELRLAEGLVLGVEQGGGFGAVFGAEAFLFSGFGVVGVEGASLFSAVEAESVFHGLELFFEPVSRGPRAGVSVTPNARPIAFQQVVPW